MPRIVAQFEARYRSAQTLQASFLERYIENGRVVRAEAGTAYFRRPGKMRWEYESPEKNLFLVDGKSAWFYVPADHTVTRVPAKGGADWRTPLALLAGDAKVSRVCERVELAGDEKPDSADDVVLLCVLRGTKARQEMLQQGPEKTVLLEISPGTGDLARVLVRESGGVSVEFHFANWRTDPLVSNTLFRFDPPPGVAIVNGELPAGENDKR